MRITHLIHRCVNNMAQSKLSFKDLEARVGRPAGVTTDATKGNAMTKAFSTSWSTWIDTCGLAGLLVAAGCGKSNWSTGVEAGAGGALGGQVGSVDAGQVDSPVGRGGGAPGGRDGSVMVDAPAGMAGSVGAGGTDRVGLGGASAGFGGAGSLGGFAGGTGGGLPFGGSGTMARTGGAGGLGVGGAAGADAGLGGVGAAIAGSSGGADAGGFGGRGGAGGVAGGTGGRTVSSGGFGGRVDAASPSSTTDALPPGTIWTPRWLVPLCPSDFPAANCATSSTSVCTRGTSYDVYLCSSTGRWERGPDDCPRIHNGDVTCTGQYWCYYVEDFCSCDGKGSPTVCTDIRQTGLLNPPDAAPPPDAREPLPILACPADMATAACDPQVQRYCSLPNVRDLCMCAAKKWTCSATPCPTTLVPKETTCDATDRTLRCMSDDEVVCDCFPTGVFACNNL